jgi:hypothetical protein
MRRLASKGKRPPNAYILYCIKNRQLVQDANPVLANKEITQKLADNWASFSPEEKRPYKEEADEYLLKFREDNPDYHYDKSKKKRLAEKPRENVSDLESIIGDEHIDIGEPSGYLIWLGAQVLLQYLQQNG